MVDRLQARGSHERAACRDSSYRRIPEQTPAMSSPASPPPNEPLLRMDVATAAGTARVRLAGDLDLSTEPAVRARVAALRGDGSTRIVLDLAELDFIDSTGLQLILELYGDAAQDSFTLALVPGGDAVQRVFAVTGTAEVLPFIEG